MTDKALSLHNDYCLKLIRERKQGLVVLFSFLNYRDHCFKCYYGKVSTADIRVQEYFLLVL